MEAQSADLFSLFYKTSWNKVSQSYLDVFLIGVDKIVRTLYTYQTFFFLLITYVSRTLQNQDIGNINEWIRSSANQWKGFHTMELVLTRCNEDVISKNGISWIEIAAATVVKV